MPDPRPSPPPARLSAEDALAQLRPEIDLVTHQQLVTISVDISYAHRIAIAAARNIQSLMPDLERLPCFDIERVRRLAMYADAAWEAHLIAILPEGRDRVFPARVAEAVKLRKELLATADLLAQFGHGRPEGVAAIRKGSGYLDLTMDLDFLAMFFRSLPKSLLARTLVTREMIARAPILSTEIISLAAQRKFPGPRDDASLASIRHKAFSLLVRVYTECRRGVGFLREPFGDAERYAPSLFLKQRRRKRAPKQPADPTTPPA